MAEEDEKDDASKKAIAVPVIDPSAHFLGPLAEETVVGGQNVDQERKRNHVARPVAADRPCFSLPLSIQRVGS